MLRHWLLLSRNSERTWGLLHHKMPLLLYHEQVLYLHLHSPGWDDLFVNFLCTLNSLCHLDKILMDTVLLIQKNEKITLTMIRTRNYKAQDWLRILHLSSNKFYAPWLNSDLTKCLLVRVELNVSEMISKSSRGCQRIAFNLNWMICLERLYCLTVVLVNSNETFSSISRWASNPWFYSMWIYVNLSLPSWVYLWEFGLHAFALGFT